MASGGGFSIMGVITIIIVLRIAVEFGLPLVKKLISGVKDAMPAHAFPASVSYIQLKLKRATAGSANYV